MFQWVLPIKGEYILVGDQLQLRPVLPDPCDGRVQEVDYQCTLYRVLSIPKGSEIRTGRERTELLDSVVAFLEPFNFFLLLSVLCCACHCVLWFCTSVFLCEGVCLFIRIIQADSVRASRAITEGRYFSLCVYLSYFCLSL